MARDGIVCGQQSVLQSKSVGLRIIQSYNLAPRFLLVCGTVPTGDQRVLRSETTLTLRARTVS